MIKKLLLILFFGYLNLFALNSSQNQLRGLNDQLLKLDKMNIFLSKPSESKLDPILFKIANKIDFGKSADLSPLIDNMQKDAKVEIEENLKKLKFPDLMKLSDSDLQKLKAQVFSQIKSIDSDVAKKSDLNPLISDVKNSIDNLINLINQEMIKLPRLDNKFIEIFKETKSKELTENDVNNFYKTLVSGQLPNLKNFEQASDEIVKNFLQNLYDLKKFEEFVNKNLSSVLSTELKKLLIDLNRNFNLARNNLLKEQTYESLEELSKIINKLKKNFEDLFKAVANEINSNSNEMLSAIIKFYIDSNKNLKDLSSLKTPINYSYILYTLTQNKFFKIFVDQVDNYLKELESKKGLFIKNIENIKEKLLITNFKQNLEKYISSDYTSNNELSYQGILSELLKKIKNNSKLKEDFEKIKLLRKKYFREFAIYSNLLQKLLEQKINKTNIARELYLEQPTETYLKYFYLSYQQEVQLYEEIISKMNQIKSDLQKDIEANKIGKDLGDLILKSFAQKESVASKSYNLQDRYKKITMGINENILKQFATFSSLLAAKKKEKLMQAISEAKEKAKEEKEKMEFPEYKPGEWD